MSGPSSACCAMGRGSQPFTHRLSVPERENQAREEWTDRQAHPPACGKWGGTHAWHGFVRQVGGLSLGLLRAHGKAVTKQLLFGEVGEAHNSLPAAGDGRASGRRVDSGGLGFQAASLGAAALTEADMQGSSALMRTEHSGCPADGTVESVTWVLQRGAGQGTRKHQDQVEFTHLLWAPTESRLLLKALVSRLF